ncbi:Ger(x)C family spore germination protein [Inediibacterium massiliense]|uniref:Ger(x)C family spore germination protein n=1 Tax=Inediibacterium massiliense TaxID=1658111 RepID=UPI0006B5B98E|nr:Ger(x)C family spore germination protein [Inediibacterium massiliense]
MYKKVLLCMMSILLLTGCWDKIEIEKRAFVAIVGIDKYEENKIKIENTEEEKIDQVKNRYLVTISYPNTGLLAQKGQGDAKYVYSAVGDNLEDILDEFETRTGRTLNFRQTQAIVLGEKLAQDEIFVREVLDNIERSPAIGRKIYLMNTRGNAEDVVKVKVKDELGPGLFIREVMRRKKVTPRIPDADLGYVLKSLHESKAAVTPRMMASKDEIKVAGSAVLKDFKLVGWLGEQETEKMMFMLNKINGGILNTKVDNIRLPLKVTNSNTKMKVYEKNGQIYTSFDIEVETELSQHLFEVRNQPLDDTYLKRVQKKASMELNQAIEKLYKKIQKDFQTDLVQSGEYLRKYEPNIWKEVREDWSEIFPITQVKVNSKIIIRRIGDTR